jgi:transposase, IS5 family
MLHHRQTQQKLSSVLSATRKTSSTFLDDVSRLVDWESFRTDLSTLYSSTTGRPAHDPVGMLKLVFVQRVYDLSDEEVVRQLDDRRSFERFVGLERVEATSLVYFRRRLREEGELLDKLLSKVNLALARYGLSITGGSIVDATLIKSRHRADSVNEKTGEVIDGDVGRVVDPHKKEGPMHEGMKVHLKCSAEDGVIQRVRVTRNTVHDTKEFCSLIEGTETMVYADRGYDSEKNREYLSDRTIKDGIMRRRVRGHDDPENRNRQLRRPRSKIEHVFGVLKRTTMKRLRYKGAKTNLVQVIMDAIVYNLKRGVKHKYGLSPSLYVC